MRRLTLSAKLIAVMAALVAGACTVIGVISYAATRSSLMSAFDGQLQTSSKNFAMCIQHEESLEHHYEDCNRGQPQGMLGVRVVGGRVTYCSVVSYQSQTGCKLSAADARTLLTLPVTNRVLPSPGGTAPGSAPSGSDASDAPPPGWGSAPPVLGTSFGSSAPGGGYRLTAVSLEKGETLISGLPVSGVDHQLSQVAVADVSVILGVLVLAGLIGGLLIRISLRPLHRVAATAAHVAELPLDTGAVSLPLGVPDADPHTEVGQVSTAFNRMLGQVARALSRRAASEARLRRFAADASHELRTPLAAIRGYAEFALRHPGPVPDDVTHALSRVQAESARMSVLVDDLLLLARLDAGRPLDQEPVDLSRLAIDVTSDARVAVADHRWTLELPDEPVLVTGDEHRLHQVLANLLSNAGKHTPPGSTVTVALRVAPAIVSGQAADGQAADESMVRHGATPPLPFAEIAVSDDGPGIPPDLLPEVFERFARADTSRARSGPNGDSGHSTGLGLAIVSAVVIAHGGSVAVTSRPGRTVFTIQLPG